MLRFDANLRWLFTEVPMAERYERAAAAGFSGVEVAFPYATSARETAARLNANGLRLVQILTPFDWDAGERGIAALPGREAEFRDSLRTAAAYALETGKPLIHVMAGRVPTAEDRCRCCDVFLENLAWAADAAAADDLTLVIEPCCTTQIPDFLCHRIAEAAAIVRTLGRHNVKLCFDTFHVQMEEGEVVAPLLDFWSEVGHLQVGDAPGRCEPGTGVVDFDALFETLEERGWPGWVGCEYRPSTETVATLGWGLRFGLHDPRISPIVETKSC